MSTSDTQLKVTLSSYGGVSKYSDDLQHFLNAWDEVKAHCETLEATSPGILETQEYTLDGATLNVVIQEMTLNIEALLLETKPFINLPEEECVINEDRFGKLLRRSSSLENSCDRPLRERSKQGTFVSRARSFSCEPPCDQRQFLAWDQLCNIKYYALQMADLPNLIAGVHINLHNEQLHQQGKQTQETQHPSTLTGPSQSSNDHHTSGGRHHHH